MSRKKPDPAQQELARAQASASTEQMALQRQMFAQALEEQGRDRVLTERQLGLNEEWQREALADRDFFRDRWENTTRRQEDEFFRAVDEFDTEGNRRQLANQGMADVQSQLGRARRDTGNMMRRRGINMGSARAIGAMAGMDLEEAAMGASAFNMATTAARREGMDLRRMAAGFTNPLNTSQQFMGAASGYGGDMMNLSGRGVNFFAGQAQNAGSLANQYAGSANSAFNSMAQQQGGGFNLGGAITGGLAAYMKTGNPYAAAAGALGGGLKGG